MFTVIGLVSGIHINVGEFTFSVVQLTLDMNVDPQYRAAIRHERIPSVTLALQELLLAPRRVSTIKPKLLKCSRKSHHASGHN